ncbi:hypothetical protein [Pedobacter sp. L105]|uniref:hypothetical protein n=1 Tax=Pedobacter sp. L105 TaxID=1641871 RepID=UPI00131DE1C4|nr:hypothetical protein [Pedobacter sp. L105]
MKRTYMVLIAMFAFSRFSYAQWSVDGNNVNIVNTNTGNVGIGTSSPTDKLEVAGAIRSTYWHPTGSISDDLYLDVEPGTRNLRTRNWNTASPNVGATGFHTGTGFFENAVGVGTINPKSVLDVGKMLASGELGSVLARVSEGNDVGGGTYLGIKGYDTQTSAAVPSLYDVKSFAIEHSFYGQTNSSINFLRGLSFTGGSLSFNTGNNVEKMRILYNGNVGIGITNPLEKLAVNGIVHSQEVIVDMKGWSDYVFNTDYSILPLADVKTYIGQNHHLPDMPSEKEVLAQGVKLGDMNEKLLKKIEELTLYLIEKDQQLKDQQKINQSLEERLNILEQKVSNLR